MFFCGIVTTTCGSRFIRTNTYTCDDPPSERPSKGSGGDFLELSPEHLRCLLDVALFQQKGPEGMPGRHHPAPRLVIRQSCVEPFHTRDAKIREDFRTDETNVADFQVKTMMPRRGRL